MVTYYQLDLTTALAANPGVDSLQGITIPGSTYSSANTQGLGGTTLDTVQIGGQSLNTTQIYNVVSVTTVTPGDVGTQAVIEIDLTGASPTSDTQVIGGYFHFGAQGGIYFNDDGNGGGPLGGNAVLAQLEAWFTVNTVGFVGGGTIANPAVGCWQYTFALVGDQSANTASFASGAAGDSLIIPGSPLVPFTFAQFNNNLALTVGAPTASGGNVNVTISTDVAATQGSWNLGSTTLGYTSTLSDVQTAVNTFYSGSGIGTVSGGTLDMGTPFTVALTLLGNPVVAEVTPGTIAGDPTVAVMTPGSTGAEIFWLLTFTSGSGVNSFALSDGTSSTGYIPDNATASDISTAINTILGNDGGDNVVVTDATGATSGPTATIQPFLFYDASPSTPYNISIFDPGAANAFIPSPTGSAGGLPEIQSLTLPGSINTLGSFTLAAQTITFGQTVTNAITAADITAALTAASISATAIGPNNGPWTIYWTVAGSQSLLTATNVSLGTQEVQSLTMPSTATAGQFTITTWTIAYGQSVSNTVTSTDVQNGINAVLGGGTVAVTGSNGGPFTITWAANGSQSALAAVSLTLTENQPLTSSNVGNSTNTLQTTSAVNDVSNGGVDSLPYNVVTFNSQTIALAAPIIATGAYFAVVGWNGSSTTPAIFVNTTGGTVTVNLANVDDWYTAPASLTSGNVPLASGMKRDNPDGSSGYGSGFPPGFNICWQYVDFGGTLTGVQSITMGSNFAGGSGVGTGLLAATFVVASSGFNPAWAANSNQLVGAF